MYINVAAITPALKLGNVKDNVVETIRNIEGNNSAIIAFPELSLTGYTCGDLFFQKELLNDVLEGIKDIKVASQGKDSIIIVGAPIRKDGQLYNCGVAIQDGKVLGVVPKTHLPNYGEFYEMRHFDSAPNNPSTITIDGEVVPFGKELIFRSGDMVLGIEICEDLWAVIPPSSKMALKGANIIINLSASNELLGKEKYRRELVKSHSAKLICAYVYVSSGTDESTSDTVFSAHNIIATDGSVVAESTLFENESIEAEIDIDFINRERIVNTTFSSELEGSKEDTVECKDVPSQEFSKLAHYPHPFIPRRKEDFDKIHKIQKEGLKARIKHTHCKTIVVGLSGGLDSTLAFLVMAGAMKELGRPMTDIIAISMPSFGTSKRTKGNAQLLAEGLGVDFREFNIEKVVEQEMELLGVTDRTSLAFENIQARARTSVLMNLSNNEGGFVVGTGDMSEIALGWCTYNGDHMSMYNVNCTIPKTLVKSLVMEVSPAEVKDIIIDIIETPISPELLPIDAENQVVQITEDIIGPYELHDFFLYHGIRRGLTVEKLYHITLNSFDYSKEEVKKHMTTFYTRFFRNQYKRNAAPDGVKIGTLDLSQRAGLRLPSDFKITWADKIAKL